jgi:hypothetical protein
MSRHVSQHARRRGEGQFVGSVRDHEGAATVQPMGTSPTYSLVRPQRLDNLVCPLRRPRPNSRLRVIDDHQRILVPKAT